MRRREFLLGAAAAPLGLAAWAQEDPANAPKRGLRTISFNVFDCRGYPQTEANRIIRNRAQAAAITRFSEALRPYEPDIITFQAAPHEYTLGEIARTLGMTYIHFESGWEGNDEWFFGYPGAVITHLRYVASENCPMAGAPKQDDLFTRHWGRAVLKYGDEEISLYSAHLHPSDEAVRAREVTEILRVMDAEKDSGRLVLFQGDLNHTPDDPEYERWVEAGFVDTLAAKGDRKAKTYPSTKPKRRVDYIWAHGQLAERLRSSRVLFEGAFRTVRGDETSVALSDHVPILAEF